ncbi:MAG TPA: site-2 protease family protein [Gemmataceae bacterium]|nr:site-2 protease family protein [Gemmataceae bacterium]
MLRSFKIGKLFGIPLYVHTTFFLLPAWVLLLNSGTGLVNALFLLLGLTAVFACVVLHELGHALMARFFGIGTENITLFPIGGVARLRRMSDKPFEEICIALAGPAVNLVLAALLAPLALLNILMAVKVGSVLYSPELGLGVALGRLAFWLWSANVMLLLFNLLPCFPMDGGRVLRALLTLWKGQLRATEIAVRVGLVMAFFIACLAVPTLSPMPILLAIFVLFAGQMELMGLRQREAQRRAAVFAQPVEAAVPAEEPPRSNEAFSGVAWDSEYRVWVKWQNGRPVAYWG